MAIAERRKGDGQRRPLLSFSAAFSLAALIAVLVFDGTVWVGLAISGAVLFASGLIMALRPGLRRPVLLVGFAVGALWCAGFIALRYSPATTLNGLSAHVVFQAERYAVGYTGYGVVDGQLLSVDGREVSVRARVYLEDGSPEVKPGDTLSFAAKLSLADTAIKKGHLANGRYILVTQKGSATTLSGQPSGLRQWGVIAAHRVGAQIATLLDGDEAGLLTALLTGDRSRYSRELNAALMNSGTSHITAVSGLHVSIFVAFWVLIWGKRIGLYTVLPIIFFYAAIAGFSPSILRAAIMCGVTVIAFATRREHDSLTALFVALLALVAINPFAIVSASLALSFSSTLGILVFAPMLLRGLRAVMPTGRGLFARGLNYVYNTTAASVASMAFTLPLCMVFFPRVSLISALTTALVLWAVSVAMVGGLAVLVLSLLWRTGAAFLAEWMLYWPLTYMVRLIKTLGGQRWVAASDSLYFALAALTLLAVLLATKKGRLKGGVSLALAMTAFSLFFALTAAENRLYSDLVIHSSGSSAVVLMRSGDRAMALNMGGIDGGRGAAFVDDTLAGWGIATLDTAVLSSDSYRQAGGLPQVLDRIGLGALYIPEGGSVGHDSVPALWYSESGALMFGGAQLELHRVSESRYIPRLLTAQYSLLDLCGVHPLDAAATQQGLPASDILIVDQAYADSPVTFGRICAMARPGLVLFCDDGFTGTYALERQCDAPVLALSQSGDIHIKQLAK